MTNWTTVITFTYPHKAHMAKSLLESEGIENMFLDELTSQVDNFAGQAIGGIKLRVKQEDYQQAYNLLHKGGYIFEKSEYKERVIDTIYITTKADLHTCPYCKSDNIAQYKDPSTLTVIALLLLRALFPIFKKYYHCYDCDKNWRFKLKK